MHRVLTFLFAFLAAGPAFGQLPAARLNSIYPCGARQGTTVECTITGADLDGASGLDFSHPGITAESAGPGKFKVSVAANVPVGPYDVRAVTPRGLSNFRAFTVSDWAEVVEAEPDDQPGQAQAITLPVVVNGRIDKPTDVDCYRFTARQGQRVSIDCWAWRVDSQLDGTIMVYDDQGKELGYSGDFAGKDPFLDFTAPADGAYVVKVWDFIYGGSGDHFYRLQIGSVPHLDAVIPAAVRPGETTTLVLLGRNLPGGAAVPGSVPPLETTSRTIEVPAEPGRESTLRGGEPVRPPQAILDGMAYRLSTPEGSSNPIFLAYSAVPVVVEHEPNDVRTRAQEVPVPSEVSGTFAPAGDVDFYSFPAAKGEKIVAEMYGERQSGQIDPFLAAFDAAGKRLFSGDDATTRNIGQLRFTTTTRDARWEFTAPADGVYSVQVRDLYYQQRGEPRFVYRLSVRRPRPDFRLVAVPTHDIHPDATTIGRGGRSWLDVLASREDGFNEPIAVTATDLPPGVTCAPVVIGPSKTSVPLVLDAAPDAPIGEGRITITGTATIEGRSIARIARGGGLTWPTVNTPGIARMADGVPIAVREAPPFVVTAEPAATEVRPGDKLSIAITIARAGDWNSPVQLSGFDLPDNATVALVNIAAGATQGKVELALGAKLKPGTYSFTINGAGQVPRNYFAQRDPGKPRGNNLRGIMPSNPITLHVTAPAAKATEIEPPRRSTWACGVGPPPHEVLPNPHFVTEIAEDRNVSV